MGYSLEGDLLEVCNCNVLCPCWIGEDPDPGHCESSLAYVIHKGEVDGLDVSGLVIASSVYIPGNVLAGNWKQKIYIDDRASDEQAQALEDVMRGRLGGPVADLAALVAEVVSVNRAKIDYDLTEGSGRYSIEGVLEATMKPYVGPSGKPTTLNESIFSTIPGSPAYVSKAERFAMKEPELGIDLDLKNNNAIQGLFRFEHEAAPA